MAPKFVAAVALAFVVSPSLRADGCKFLSDGRMVPEREQRAVVEWADGTETLYVAALSDPTAAGSVWVVPVRAAAAAVRVEPVEEFPAVVYFETLRRAAELRLRDSIAVAAILDSGGLCCPFFFGGCSGGSSAGAAEVSRVEKLGMVVTVVSADTRAALERYLDAQGVNRAATDLSSVEPYFGGSEYSFVCGWVASRDVPSAAAALKVEFPSPTLWFPLRPTRAYTNAVETVVYTRGYVKPAPGCDLPGLTCEYISAAAEPKGVRHAFTSDRPRAGWETAFEYHFSGRLERMTRVTLANDPQKWDRDLELVPGTTPVGTAAVAITGWAGYLGPLWSALLGTVLGLAIPWLSVEPADRRWYDRLAGALVGAAVVGSIWASVVVFVVWRWLRFRGRPNPPTWYVVLPSLAVVHFAIVLAVCRGLMAWMRAGG